MYDMIYIYIVCKDPVLYQTVSSIDCHKGFFSHLNLNQPFCEKLLLTFGHCWPSSTLRGIRRKWWAKKFEIVRRSLKLVFVPWDGTRPKLLNPQNGAIFKGDWDPSISISTKVYMGLIIKGLPSQDLSHHFPYDGSFKWYLFHLSGDWGFMAPPNIIPNRRCRCLAAWSFSTRAFHISKASGNLYMLYQPSTLLAAVSNM